MEFDNGLMIQLEAAHVTINYRNLVGCLTHKHFITYLLRVLKSKNTTFLEYTIFFGGEGVIIRYLQKIMYEIGS